MPKTLLPLLLVVVVLRTLLFRLPPGVFESFLPSTPEDGVAADNDLQEDDEVLRAYNDEPLSPVGSGGFRHPFPIFLEVVGSPRHWAQEEAPYHPNHRAD